ncbi:hypothetical protein CDD83_6823 [Cordyceps sp. RAO-2017]|nr:hypothetical protein CDD83_6823 [Cordyceps sp. RAO-2017]
MTQEYGKNSTDARVQGASQAAESDTKRGPVQLLPRAGAVASDQGTAAARNSVAELTRFTTSQDFRNASHGRAAGEAEPAGDLRLERRGSWPKPGVDFCRIYNGDCMHIEAPAGICSYVPRNWAAELASIRLDAKVGKCRFYEECRGTFTDISFPGVSSYNTFKSPITKRYISFMCYPEPEKPEDPIAVGNSLKVMFGFDLEIMKKGVGNTSRVKAILSRMFRKVVFMQHSNLFFAAAYYMHESARLTKKVQEAAENKPPEHPWLDGTIGSPDDARSVDLGPFGPVFPSVSGVDLAASEAAASLKRLAQQSMNLNSVPLLRVLRFNYLEYIEVLKELKGYPPGDPLVKSTFSRREHAAADDGPWVVALQKFVKLLVTETIQAAVNETTVIMKMQK